MSVSIKSKVHHASKQANTVNLKVSTLRKFFKLFHPKLQRAIKKKMELFHEYCLISEAIQT